MPAPIHFCALALLASALPGDPPVLSLDERLLATIPDGLVLEGKPITSPDGRTTVPNVHRVTWSPDGSAVGFVGLKGETPHAVVGETVHGSYHWIEGPAFSADGQHWAFRVGKRVEKDRERWWVLRDGKEEGAQNWIGSVALAPDGSAAAAWTQPGARIAAGGEYRPGDLVLVSPWRKGAEWDDALALMPPRFGPSGSFLTTLAMQAGTWRLLLVDKKGERELGKPQSWITDWDISDDGKTFVLAVADASGGNGAGAAPPGMPPGMLGPGGKSVVVFGKSTWGREHDDASSPRLSPDGKHVAYRIRAKGRQGVALDAGKDAQPGYDGVVEIVFRPDGKEVGFVACDGCRPVEGLMSLGGSPVLQGGTWRVVARGASGREQPVEGAWAEVRDLTWSRDGKRLAFATRSADGWRVVCGERTSAAFDEVGPPRFAPDGKKLAFGARAGRELHWKVLALE
jgi:dipeptidyl aminopeptidase/acylaminoacyl peptidase